MTDIAPPQASPLAHSYQYANADKTVVLLFDADGICRRSCAASVVPEGTTIADAVVAREIPTTVSMKGAQRALLRAGLLDAVEAAVEASTDRELKISWNKSAIVERHDHFTQSMAALLSLTDAQLDDLFALANTL